MPPSQLKQLKASLRDQGLVGPQKSKKQKKHAAKDTGARQKRNAALQSIREQFNPFEAKAPARKEKFEVASVKDGRPRKGVLGRPGVTKGLGEERRRATLLKEIQSRNRVGRILDRRFGENDPTMTPEQRAAERFARQSERQSKKQAVFSLEDEEDDSFQLTHMGRALGLGEGDGQDDFKEDNFSRLGQGVEGHQEDLGSEEDNARPSKRRRLSEDHDVPNDDNGLQVTERRKTKHEVMKEVIAKSKLHKYERQQAKEDDDDLRAELDKGLPDFLESMRNYRKPPPPLPAAGDSVLSMDPDRAALLAGKDRQEADQEYNERVRQMTMDKRSKPSTRTKTDEEKAEEEAALLRDLEQKRLRRMTEGPDSSDDGNGPDSDPIKDHELDDAEAFGLGQVVNGTKEPRILDVEDEDDFVMDDDLIASDSEADLALEDEEASEDGSPPVEDDGDDDFINGLVLPPEPASLIQNPGRLERAEATSASNLSFTYPCPETHEEFLGITKNVELSDVPTVVQRIRTLYHPKLAAGNKEKLAKLAAVLTQHVSYLAEQEPRAPFAVLESLLRHLHSLAKSHPSAVAAAFRAHLRTIADDRPLELRPGDLIILTGISTIFPTSDHFHSVVTPAMLTMARFLGHSSKPTLVDLIKGAYICTLAFQYQSLSKRYIPEVMTYIQQALALLTGMPSVGAEHLANINMPSYASLQLSDSEAQPHPSLRFKDLYIGDTKLSNDTATKEHSAKTTTTHNRLRATLISHFLTLLTHAANLWQDKSSFSEIFHPTTLFLQTLLTKSPLSSPSTCLSSTLLTQITTLHTRLRDLTTASLDHRTPLLLHQHRPLPIKTSLPKFEESYNPTSHYDPDRERSQLNKLRAEHKRERKGAMRELRKDANFIARESLREKKVKDREYERKMRRIVGEIQSGEGHEGKVYEREREREKGRRRRK